MTDSQALLCVIVALLALSVIETAVARNWETDRRGTQVTRGGEKHGELFFKFIRVLFVTYLANLSLATPIVLFVSAVGRGAIILQLKDWVWGGVLTLLMVVAMVLSLAASAGFVKFLFYFKLRREERWRAGWLGLMGGMSWTYLMCAGVLLDWRGVTSIQEAVSKNNIEAATTVLSHASPPSAELDSAWHDVALHADSKMADLLLKAGANIDSPGTHGRTLVEEALLAKKEELANHLLERGAGAHGEALHLAARAGMVSVVRKLLKKGADVNALSADKITPLLAAIGTRQDTPRAMEVVPLLLEHGADPNLAGHSSGGDGGEVVSDETPLGQATTCHRLDVVRLLLARGVRLDVANQNQMTPLHLALWLKYNDVAAVLIEGGAPLDKPDRLGRKPRDMTDNKDLLKLMKAHGGAN